MSGLVSSLAAYTTLGLPNHVQSANGHEFISTPSVHLATETLGLEHRSGKLPKGAEVKNDEMCQGIGLLLRYNACWYCFHDIAVHDYIKWRKMYKYICPARRFEDKSD